jgi:hypothetical protein
VFKFSIALSTAKEGFRFTIDLYTNFFTEPEAGRDFRLGLPSAAAVKFSKNGIKGDFRYIALYIKFPASKLGGYGKEIFKFSMEPCAANVPFQDLIFGVG